MKKAKTNTGWPKQWIEDFRRNLYRDMGCRMERDPVHDQNGDITGFTNARAVLLGKMVDSDCRIEVKLCDTGQGAIEGLSLDEFNGLAFGPTDDPSDAVARFKNGRSLPLVKLQHSEIDPQEQTRREMAMQRIRAERTAANCERKPAQVHGKRGAPPRYDAKLKRRVEYAIQGCQSIELAAAELHMDAETVARIHEINRKQDKALPPARRFYRPLK